MSLALNCVCSHSRQDFSATVDSEGVWCMCTCVLAVCSMCCNALLCHLSTDERLRLYVDKRGVATVTGHGLDR